jgi:CheY-like chemotaxis protein
MQILALVRDLMFSSKITAEARAANVACKIIRDPAQLPAADPTAPLLLVDLNLPGAIEAAATWRQTPGAQTSGRVAVGFVSHVDSDTITKARAAGIDQVLARSQFVATLAERLASVAAADKSQEK